MINIGLKLWNINKNYLSIAKTLYQEKIINYIELYIVPNNTHLISCWADLNIPFDIHAPHSAHNMNLSIDKNFDHNLALYSEVKKYADSLNARYIVFHGGIDGEYKETARQLIKFNDSRILIENKPHKVLKKIKAEKYIGTKPEEIEYIMNFSNCGFCLDVGHAICAANSYGIEPYEYIENFYKLKANKIHLSDLMIDTEIDSHLNFGQGNIDFNKIFYILDDVKDITIETNKKSEKDLNDFIQDVQFIKELDKCQNQ